jgi:hypothetical protein
MTNTFRNQQNDSKSPCSFESGSRSIKKNDSGVFVPAKELEKERPLRNISSIPPHIADLLARSDGPSVLVEGEAKLSCQRRLDFSEEEEINRS